MFLIAVSSGLTPLGVCSVPDVDAKVSPSVSASPNFSGFSNSHPPPDDFLSTHLTLVAFQLDRCDDVGGRERVFEDQVPRPKIGDALEQVAGGRRVRDVGLEEAAEARPFQGGGRLRVFGTRDVNIAGLRRPDRHVPEVGLADRPPSVSSVTDIDGLSRPKFDRLPVRSVPFVSVRALRKSPTTRSTC